MTKNYLKHIAIVGMGSAGRRHFRIVKKLFPNMIISLVRSGKGKKCLEDEIADNLFKSIPEACENNVDAAIISSPANLHIPQSEKFIKQKIHVLIEKPISTSKKHILELNELAENNTTIAQVGYVLRHNKSLQYFEAKIREGFIGNPLNGRIVCSSYLPNWRPGQNYKNSVSAKPELGGGVLLELSHELDYLIWLFGDFLEVQSKIIKSNNLGIQCSDTAYIISKHPNNFICSIHLDFNSQISTRECYVTGSEGTIVWDGVNQTVHYNGINGYFKKSFNKKTDYMYQNQILNFFKSCMYQEIPSVKLLDSFKVMEVIELIEKSDRTGKVVVR